MQRGIEYAKQIVNKDIPSGELEYLSCERFLEDLERDWEYVFDESRADRIIKFIENYCRQSKGVFAGKTITLLPFQVYDLINIFGWVNKTDGARRFTRAFIEMARGNAKSTIMSAIALYGMMADVIYPPGKPEKILFEKNPQVVCTAYDREQARIVLDEAKVMAQASTEIMKRLIVKKGYVEHKERGGSLKALSKDTRNKDGMNVSIAILDQLVVLSRNT
jgi:phage terminase large subunit-like protein